MFINMHKNLKKSSFLLIGLALFMQSACGCMPKKQTAAKPEIIFPTKSFVQVWKTVRIEECKPKTTCSEGDYASTGSGSVIARGRGYSVILTAKHVCLPNFAPEVESMILKKKSVLTIRTWKNEMMPAEVLLVADHPRLDLCALKVLDFGVTPIKESTVGPQVGERIYSMGSPLGVFHPPSVPLLEGFYSGDLEDGINSLSSIPAVGGSSGSVILNNRSQVIGVLFASVRNFHHVSLISNYAETTRFIQKAKKKLLQEPLATN